jgi:hypothetical protein
MRKSARHISGVGLAVSSTLSVRQSSSVSLLGSAVCPLTFRHSARILPMKSTTSSVDVSNGVPLAVADLPPLDSAGRPVVKAWRPDVVSDDNEQEFIAATAGLEPDVVEHIREVAIVAALIRTMGELERLCDRLKGKDATVLRGVLRRIGERGREEVDQHGIDASDFIRTALIGFYSIPSMELPHLVAACVAYGKEAARCRLREIAMELPRSAVGEALRHVLGQNRGSLRKSAKRVGVSPAALCKRTKRIRAKLHGKS